MHAPPDFRSPPLQDCRWQPSHLRALSPWQARGALVLLAVVIVGGIAVACSSLSQGFADATDRGPGDRELFAAKAERIAAGEGYYEAAAVELTDRGYPTQSVFNWRTPLPMWLLGRTSLLFGKVLLIALAAVLLLTAFEWTAREGGAAVAVLTSLLLLAALLPCVLGDLVVMPVLWAGVLIALSVSLLGLGKARLGVVSGVAALFIRELAGPFCAGACMYALWKKQYREAASWAAGIALYLVFFAWHAVQVAAHQPTDGHAHAASWIQLAGAPFVLATAQMNTLLLLSPQWLTAVYLPLALLGFVSWTTDAGQRAGLAAVGYLLLFAVVGQEFNQYWGALTAPLLCLGAGRAPLAMRDLWRAAQG
ncbi:MAG: hypothetical protein WD030_08340, partial [Pirellulales bacterium]